MAILPARAWAVTWVKLAQGFISFAVPNGRKQVPGVKGDTATTPHARTRTVRFKCTASLMFGG
jgi:hypothetical protein